MNVTTNSIVRIPQRVSDVKCRKEFLFEDSDRSKISDIVYELRGEECEKIVESVKVPDYLHGTKLLEKGGLAEYFEISPKRANALHVKYFRGKAKYNSQAVTIFHINDFKGVSSEYNYNKAKREYIFTLKSGETKKVHNSGLLMYSAKGILNFAIRCENCAIAAELRKAIIRNKPQMAFLEKYENLLAENESREPEQKTFEIPGIVPEIINNASAGNVTITLTPELFKEVIGLLVAETYKIIKKE